MSARIIGREFGLNAQEMNKTLAQYGYLDGSPGLWTLTEKGEQFAHEQHEHRGNGGYAHYNRDWTVTTYHDSIIAALEADIAENPNPPSIDYSHPADDARDNDYDEPSENAGTGRRDGLTDAQKLVLLLAAAAVVAYGAKELYPRAKRRWMALKGRRAASRAGTEAADDAEQQL